MLEKMGDKLITRFMTFLSLEKTGLKNELLLSHFCSNVLYACPSLEILILNSLPINDKILNTLSTALQNALKSPQKLARNLKELGLSNTKITDKSTPKLFFVLMKHSFLEVINLECNSKVGFSTASFILQQLVNSGSSSKISLREVFLEYTKVSYSFRRSLDVALHSYQNGNLNAVARISKRYSTSSYRSQPRQNSSRYAFANDFWILNEKESDTVGTDRTKSNNKSTTREIEESVTKLKDLNTSSKKSILNTTSDFIKNESKKNFAVNNHLFYSNEKNKQ
jgi:hypothetical protein